MSLLSLFKVDSVIINKFTFSVKGGGGGGGGGVGG